MLSLLVIRYLENGYGPTLMNTFMRCFEPNKDTSEESRGSRTGDIDFSKCIIPLSKFRYTSPCRFCVATSVSEADSRLRQDSDFPVASLDCIKREKSDIPQLRHFTGIKI